MTRFLFFLLVVLIVSCGVKERDSSSVFFAGEIVNPTSDKVVLFRGDEPLDTAYLDQFNRFAIELDTIVDGLHHFLHHPEGQYVYLEKGDSIQLRLNTINFDESLVYSGIGEEINNFMVEMFLVDEVEERQVYGLYKLEPEIFAAKIDSLRNSKLKGLEDLNVEFALSEGAYETAKAGIEYANYIYMEAYPFYHRKKTGEKIFHSLPADFYNYRQEINFNYNELVYLRPYYNFMKYHLGNVAYMSCMDKCGDIELESNQLHFNKHKLFLIDSLVQHKELRDNLYRNVAVDYLLKHDNEENLGEFIDNFREMSANNRHMGEINQLYDGIKRIQPSKELPELVLYSLDDNPVSLADLSKGKKTVFYFWSGSEMGHFKNINKRVANLKSKYPQYNFIGINLRTDLNRWKSLVETHNLNPSEQFRADDYATIMYTLVISEMNKSIIAKDGVIHDAFANVYQSF